MAKWKKVFLFYILDIMSEFCAVIQGVMQIVKDNFFVSNFVCMLWFCFIFTDGSVQIVLFVLASCIKSKLNALNVLVVMRLHLEKFKGC